MKKTISIVLAVLMGLFPLIIWGSDNTIQTEPCQQAIADAKADVSAWQWIGVGCLFTLFGVAAAYIIKPTPPPDKLLGKSPEYVESYTDCFVKQCRRTRGGNAWIGLGVSTAATLVVGIVVLAAAASAGQSCAESCTDNMTQSCIDNACSYGW
jgi:hypothetical protein